jgi:hypothetical protein
MRDTSSFNILAAVLILMGIALLLENYGIIHGIWMFWPALPLIIGIGFCMLYFRSGKDIVMLGLGTFILLNSILFIYLNFTMWSLLAYLWPVFIVILGLSLLACYIFSKVKRNILIYLAVLLMALGASFIVIFAVSTILWPTSLIFAGLSFVIISFFEKRAKETRGTIHAKKK